MLSKLYYQFLANSIALLHLLWGLWGAIGAILALTGYYPKHPISWAIYLAAMIGNGLYLTLFDHCPLTIWEKKFRLRYNPKAKILDKYSTYYLERLTGIKTPEFIVWIFIWTMYICNIIGFLRWW